MWCTRPKWPDCPWFVHIDDKFGRCMISVFEEVKKVGGGCRRTREYVREKWEREKNSPPR